jgi:hypothetical protein
MTRLTTKARNKLPAKVFAGPGRTDPIPDKKHARAALMDVGKQKGLTPEEKAHVRAVAREKLRHGA